MTPVHRNEHAQINPTTVFSVTHAHTLTNAKQDRTTNDKRNEEHLQNDGDNGPVAQHRNNTNNLTQIFCYRTNTNSFSPSKQI